MAADFTKLQTTIDALTAQVKATQGVEASAKALILGQADATKTAVAAALQADDAADQGSIDAANAAIDGVTSQFAASAADLGSAIPANPGPGPGPTPPPPPPPPPVTTP